MTILETLPFIIAALVLGLLGGYMLGVRHGKDAGWLEHYFQGVEQDRQRRNRLGQFKAKGGR